MYKIGVMGDSESVLCFTPLGIDTFAVGDREHTRETFRHMVDEKYAIIYVTEHKAVFIADYIEKYFVDRIHGDWHNNVIVDETGLHIVDGMHGFDKLNGGKCPFHNSQMCFEVMERTARLLKKEDS